MKRKIFRFGYARTWPQETYSIMNKNTEIKKIDGWMRLNTHSLSLTRSLWIIQNFTFCFLFDLPCALHCARRHFAQSMSVPLKYTHRARIYGCCVFWLCREMRVSEVKPKIITVLSINLKMLLIIITTTIRAHFTLPCARAPLYWFAFEDIWRSSF